ncbi:MAG: hypothetical protein OIN88_07705, partial [Candidatus Methanoperedens sp.]|nr:hypothetical protein [Candidatus Methanoperedens sp.]
MKKAGIDPDDPVLLITAQESAGYLLEAIKNTARILMSSNRSGFVSDYLTLTTAKGAKNAKQSIEIFASFAFSAV